MARAITLTDDIDGTPGAVTRTYAIGATQYEIDLSDANWSEFLKAIEKFRTNSRVAKKKRENQAPVMNPDDRERIRAWAIANGRPIASRGRFPNDIVRDYYATMAKRPHELILA